jgi:6-phosphogluconolactonase (cycloisomerase 2 family)
VIETLAADPTTGSLRKLASSPIDQLGPDQCALDPAGKVLLVTDVQSSTLCAYLVNASTGAVTSVSVASPTAGFTPMAVTIGPLGSFAYTADVGPQTGPATFQATVTPYALGAAGKLTALPSIPVGNLPHQIVIDPTGAHLYVGCDHEIDVFTRDPSSGKLTALGKPVPIADMDQCLAMDPSGNFLYAAGNQELFSFTVDASGSLSPLSPPANIAGMGISSLVVDVSGALAFGAMFDMDGIQVFTVAASGELVLGRSVPLKARSSPLRLVATR